MENVAQSLKLLPAGRHGKTKKLCMLTAYDYPIAKILDEAGVDIVLVGDSLGNVVLGYKNTHPVTINDMVHHTKAVARGVSRALVVADMPYKALSLANAKRLVKAGAKAVKIEGNKGIKVIKKIIRAGIPVMGHIGFLPQSNDMPGIKRSLDLIDQAKALEKAGVFAIVLEMVDHKLTKQITKAIKVPTIGIGSGPDSKGQVLVTYDLIGLSDWTPSFVKKMANVRKQIKETVKEWINAPVAQLERAAVS